MSSVLHLTISGQDPSQRLQKTLTEGQSVRVGRAAGPGWKIPWDPTISREHAVFTWSDNRLHVKCLEQARNPLICRGQLTREACIGRDESFRIGHTTFHARSVVKSGSPKRNGNSQLVEFLAEEGPEGRDRTFSPAQLRQAGYANVDWQLELLEQLPDKISTAQTDGELGVQLSQLLLEAMPNAVAVAVGHFDEAELPTDSSQVATFPKAHFMCVQTREDFTGPFRPSRRMIQRCLQTQQSVMHILESSGGAQFTLSEGLDWAFCVPIKTESTQGWCLYVSGKGAAQGGVFVTEPDLLGDLRFTRLVAQFIGAIHQVRTLQEQKTQLSTFFSPKIIAGLSVADAKQVLAPAERNITVLFCDVRGFSKKAEALGDDLLSLLKSVSAGLGVMAGGIIERDGAIADFQGDAALGFWGWPTESPEGAVPACRSALASHRAFRHNVARADSLLYGFSIGMGIAHGRAVAGQIGTDQQSKVGVFGAVVNQGSRLEGLTKQFEVPICLDEASAGFVLRYLPPAEGRLRRLARVRPQGMDTPLTVFSLLPSLEESPEVTPEIIADHEAALDAILAGDWAAALAILHRLPNSDGPKKFLLRHMAGHGNTPPPTWDGAFSLGSK